MGGQALVERRASMPPMAPAPMIAIVRVTLKLLVVGRSSACEDRYSLVRPRSWALIATTTVLADISTAPTAGVRTMLQAASTPAAKGIATML